MKSVDDRKLSPLWRILTKNVRVDGNRHPLLAADKIGKCLTKRKINIKADREFLEKKFPSRKVRESHLSQSARRDTENLKEI